MTCKPCCSCGIGIVGGNGGGRLGGPSVDEVPRRCFCRTVGLSARVCIRPGLSVDSGDVVCMRPKSKSEEDCVDGVLAPNPATPGELSKVDIELGGLEEESGLSLSASLSKSSRERLLNSTVEATGFLWIGFSLICDAGNASWAVFGRLGSAVEIVDCVESDLAGVKNDVSTLILALVLCVSFAPVPSSFTVFIVSDLTTFVGCPSPTDSSWLSLLWDTLESRLDTEGSERSRGLLPLEERDALLDGMEGTRYRASFNKTRKTSEADNGLSGKVP